MAKRASECLAGWYDKTGAPLEVLAAIFGRNASNLSSVMNGREPSRPFATQLQRVQSIRWDAELGLVTMTLRVPVVRQNAAQRAKAVRQVGVLRPRAKKSFRSKLLTRKRSTLV